MRNHHRHITSSIPVLYHLTKHGRLDEIRQFLQKNPPEIINEAVDCVDGYRPLHIVCETLSDCELRQERRINILREILSQPDVNVNCRSDDLSTPLHICATRGHIVIMKLLLEDHRVEVNAVDDRGCTALWYACMRFSSDHVRLLLAHSYGLDLDQAGKREKNGRMSYTPFVVLERFSFCSVSETPAMIAMLHLFKRDPVTTRRDLRRSLRLPDEAVMIFALIVFICDDYLQPKPLGPSSGDRDKNLIRFFKIVRTLPLELQMILSYKSTGSNKTVILSKESETVFKQLARIYSLTDTR